MHTGIIVLGTIRTLKEIINIMMFICVLNSYCLISSSDFRYWCWLVRSTTISLCITELPSSPSCIQFPASCCTVSYTSSLSCTTSHIVHFVTANTELFHSMHCFSTHKCCMPLLVHNETQLNSIALFINITFLSKWSQSGNFSQVLHQLGLQQFQEPSWRVADLLFLKSPMHEYDPTCFHSHDTSPSSRLPFMSSP
jgi:hypothetical protein